MEEFCKAVEMVHEKYGEEATHLQEDGDEYIIVLNNCVIRVYREERALKVAYIPDVYTIDMDSQFYSEVEE